MNLTATTITNDDIRELRGACDDPTIELMCRTALGTVTRNGAPLSRAIIDEARADCAEVLNRRALDPLRALRSLVEALDALATGLPDDPQLRAAREHASQVINSRPKE